MADFEQHPQDPLGDALRALEAMSDLVDLVESREAEPQEHFWQMMYPEVVFTRLTDDRCEDPECDCEGGRIVERVSFSSALN